VKKLIAKKLSLKRKCDYCGKIIPKGAVYYKDRSVYSDDDCTYKIYASEIISCPKCKYKLDKHNERVALFKEACNHPEWAVETVWSYISGECVKEPDHDECRLCGKVV
jgi:NAD-dependent SIR2 family protein deacetylase